MLRKLLVASFILCQLTAAAQKNPAPLRNEPVKPTQPKPAPAAPIQTKINYDQVGAPMPSMLLVTMDTVVKEKKKRRHKKEAENFLVTSYGTKMYTDRHFDNKANLLVMMFNPTCGHCEDETDQLIKHIDLFKKSKIILLANPQMKEYLPAFAKNHHLADHKDVMTLGMDSTDFIKNTFLYQSLPQINIYNADRVLLKIYNGTVSIDTLMQYIQ